jgi:hypothetical protein
VLDRKALPAPERSGSDEATYVAPRTPTEEILAGIWKRKGDMLLFRRDCRTIVIERNPF